MSSAGNPILELDGKTFYYSFLAGASSLIEHQKELNRINVFPVADADTGTNMASTLRAIIEKVKPEKSFKVTIDAIAEAALTGARGNSGVIFAQFFYGLSNETRHIKKLRMDHFAEILHQSVKYIYEAIAEPIEGTMLTVIREWATYIHKHKNETHDFAKMFHDAYQIAGKSLQETTSKLKVLAQANVVDSGAKGFVVFLSGIAELLKTKNIRKLSQARDQVAEIDEPVIESHEVTGFRFCTEGIIRGKNLPAEEIRNKLKSYGDSVVLAGADHVMRVHVHTENPAGLFRDLSAYGTLSFQKADDMLKQYQTAHQRKYRIALVTDSTCDLPETLIDKYQIHMSHLNLNFGENQYLDKLTIRPAQFYDMLETTDTWPTTAQPNRQSFINLYSQLASHYDSIIAIHLTGKFSGTYNNSKKAAEIISSEFGKKISVIDSRTLSGALGLITYRAAMAIDQGMKHDDIVKSVENWIRNTRIFVSVKDLSYMVRGGRVSPLKGKIARMLNVKPIVSMDSEGRSLLLDKAFSQKRNIRLVMKHIEKIKQKHTIRNYILLHAHNPETASWFSDQLTVLTGTEPLGTMDISPVIGLNAGEGAVAVALTFD